MKTRFFGAKFYQPLTEDFTDELFIEDGFITTAGQFSEEVDLGGGFVFPAFRDGHAHPLFAGREANGPNVTGAKSISEIKDILIEYRNSNPGQVWIEGGAYDRSIVADGRFLASWLDEAISDVPVVIHAVDHHTVWVNSKALELLPKPIPPLRSGSVDIGPAGIPLGVLREPDAMALVLNKAPSRSLAEEVSALEWADKHLASLGIVQVQDAWITEGMTEVYIEAIKANRLSLDYNLAFKIEPANFVDSINFAIASREEVDSETGSQLSARTVKFFVDGVFGSGTASMLDPYLDGSESKGEPLWNFHELSKATLLAAKSGFQLHIHAIGDAGVRQALDAIEATQEVLGKPSIPNVIAHVELVSDSDIPRFGQLGVIANMQPLWAQKDGMLMSCQPRLGEKRINNLYRMKDLSNSGATIAFGSDWPVSSADPILGIATAVTRMTSDGLPEDGWTISQALTLKESLRAYGANVLFQMTGENPTGPGDTEAADFVLLDKDPFDVSKDQLRNIKVKKTYKSGIRIY